MAKGHKKQGVIVRQGHAQIEQSETFDDSLLPPAEELAKLKELDPDIMKWIKDRTEKEQDGRLNFNDRRMGLLESAQRKGFQMDIFVVCSAIFVLSMGMALSTYFLVTGKTQEGTIFTGSTLLAAFIAVLNFRRKSAADKTRTKSGQVTPQV